MIHRYMYSFVNEIDCFLKTLFLIIPGILCLIFHFFMWMTICVPPHTLEVGRFLR